MIYSLSIFVVLKGANFVVGILHVINFYSYSFVNLRVFVVFWIQFCIVFIFCHSYSFFIFCFLKIFLFFC